MWASSVAASIFACIRICICRRARRYLHRNDAKLAAAKKKTICKSDFDFSGNTVRITLNHSLHSALLQSSTALITNAIINHSDHSCASITLLTLTNAIIKISCKITLTDHKCNHQSLCSINAIINHSASIGPTRQPSHNDFNSVATTLSTDSLSTTSDIDPFVRRVAPQPQHPR
jgi:hypothetical protein